MVHKSPSANSLLNAVEWTDANISLQVVLRHEGPSLPLAFNEAGSENTLDEPRLQADARKLSVDNAADMTDRLKRVLTEARSRLWIKVDGAMPQLFEVAKFCGRARQQHIPLYQGVDCRRPAIKRILPANVSVGRRRFIGISQIQDADSDVIARSVPI